MKIHVVQKGETLWKLAQKYGVDFEELKQVNSHLSDPDKIMPGMKIKIPTNSKAVKKEGMKAEQPTLDKEMKKVPKEQPKEQPKTQQPYKDKSPKPTPVMKEDDSKKPMPEKEKLPMQPLNIPTIPQVPHYEEQQVDVNYVDVDVDYHQQYAHPQYQPKVQPQYVQQQVAPMQYYPAMPCCGKSPKPKPFPVQPVQQVPCQPYHFQHHHHPHHMAPGVGYNQNYVSPYSNGYPTNNDDLMESSSSLEMPQMPNHLAGVYDQNAQPGVAPVGYSQGYPTTPNVYGGYQMPGGYEQPVQPTHGTYGQAPMNVPGVASQGYGMSPGMYQGNAPQGYGMNPGMYQGYALPPNAYAMQHGQPGYPQQPGYRLEEEKDKND